MSCEQQDANTVHIAIKRGDTLRLIVDLDGLDTTDVDITGWVWLCQLRDSADALVTSLSVTVTDPAKGVLELGLSSVETAALTVADYSFDLQATDTTPDVRTLLYAQLRIRSDVSR